MPNKSEEFEHELQHLINRYSMESPSNTPDFILAQYISGCLLAFTTATQQRETWYGRNAAPSLSKDAFDHQRSQFAAIYNERPQTVDHTAGSGIFVYDPTWPGAADVSTEERKTSDLTFEEALAAMRQGKKIRRPSWTKDAAFFIRQPYGTLILKETYTETAGMDIKSFDICANDWEIAE